MLFAFSSIRYKVFPIYLVVFLAFIVLFAFSFPNTISATDKKLEKVDFVGVHFCGKSGRSA